MPDGSDYIKQRVNMQQCVVACSLFSIAVCAVVEGTLCLFSDAACCSCHFSACMLTANVNLKSRIIKRFIGKTFTLNSKLELPEIELSP